MNLRTLWSGVGWFGVLAALVLSLKPAPPQVAVQYADKLVHLMGYATLMYWWAQLYISLPQRVRVGAALVLFGIVIEGLQGLTPTRKPDAWDVLANTIGIVMGGWIAYRSINLLQFCSRYAPKSRNK